MSIIGSNILAGASGNQGYEIARSLRFDDDSSGYLSRTPGSAGNRKTWTWSGWVKRSNLNGVQQTLFSGGGTSPAYDAIRFDHLDRLQFYQQGTTTTNLVTTAVYRDTSAWYHVVLKLNSTASEAAIFINGVEQTLTGTQPTNTDGNINNTVPHGVGATAVNAAFNLYMDGYMAEVNFVDGQALDPSYFGETDPVTGAWIPKQYSGTYGTNGFYLNFLDNSGVTATTLGRDSSGNGNNWTPVNFSVTAGAGNDSLEDTPTNNWCTMSPLVTTSSTLSNGNLKVVTPTGTSSAYATFNLPTSGKWYWEYVPTANGHLAFSGIRKPLATTSTYIAYYGSSGQKWINGSASSYGATYGNNDVIGVAVNVDSNEITFYKNNTSQGAITGYTLNEGDYAPVLSDGSGAAGTTFDINFGQRAFAYTPPTGFKALNTQNLPVPTIKNGTEHFNTVLYTGTGSSNAITGVGFQPSFLWIKKRSASENHELQDAVRGATKRLASNTADVETTVAGSISSFDSDGFTVVNAGTTNENTSTYVAWNWNAGSNSSKTFTVKVVSDSGNKYRFDDFGTSAVTLDLEEGSTYVFDQSDSSNSGHPLRFSTTSDGTHGSGSEYTTGVTTTGTPGSAGAKTTIVVAASAPTLYYYCSSHSGMGGQANTNSTAGASNFAGNIQSTCRASAEAGFSIVRYTGNGTDANSNTVTVGHQLGVKPDVIITKKITSGTDYGWSTWHKDLGAGYGIWLHLSNARNAAMWDGDSNHSSTVFSPADSAYNNVSGSDYINYLFTSVEGYSKFGSYTGNAVSDGPFVHLNFRPKWVLIKSSTVATSWYLFDDTRGSIQTQGSDAQVLFPDTAAAEDANAGQGIDFLSNGFKVRAANGYGINNSATYIYMAFAEMPFKYANAS